MQKVNTSKDIKIPKILLIMLFTILIAFTILNHNSITVYATTGGNGTGNNAGGTADWVVSNGPSDAKQFWLAYITDEAGNVKSDVVLIQSQSISADASYIKTRPEHGSIGYSVKRHFKWCSDCAVAAN